MANVLITGANRGIGLELVKRYAADGHRVFACCRVPAEANVLSELAGTHDAVSIHGVQIVDGDSVAALAASLEGTPIDVLVNNAGANRPAEEQSLTSMDYDAWAELFAVNAMAPLRVLQAFLPALEASDAEPPKAITISSQMGALSLDWPVAYAYCASKAAVNKVMRMAALELKEKGIAVGLIHPGWVQTDMGGPNAAITVDESAAGVIATIDAIDLESTGCFRTWQNEDHDW
ncbi:MAG: SDR family oxidoreductase [Pseudomonadales bacterium]|jgi:NAD(P)-dependent dehydrogenase (short-subunit alcohol dehydrogenase family)|nr:SDR family oxidoreductase [Pseudomonadales bacterium]